MLRRRQLAQLLIVLLRWMWRWRLRPGLLWLLLWRLGPLRWLHLPLNTARGCERAS